MSIYTIFRFISSTYTRKVSTITSFYIQTEYEKFALLQNCEMECYSRAVENECGCVLFYMPRLNQNSKVCDRGNSRCYNPLRISMERGDNAKYNCRCYPPCAEINFSGAISTAPLIPFPESSSLLADFSNVTIL